MRNLSTTADTLRTTHQAHGRFLALWAMECLLGGSRAWERMMADLREVPAAGREGQKRYKDEG